MKTILPILLCILVAQYSTGQNPAWIQQNSPSADNFTSISVIDEQHAWIAGSSGIILYTADGGITWELMDTYAQLHFSAIHFSSSQHGCIVGWSGEVLDSTVVLVTNDGGQSWQSKEHPQGNYLYDVFFINDTRGWAVGISGVVGWIIFTDDGGNTWEHQMETLGVSGELFGVHFRDDVVGQICGVYGTFLLTNNAGTIGNGWAVNISLPTLGKDLYDLFDYGAMKGWIAGEDGTIIYTQDNWTNWDDQESGTDNDLNGVSGDEIADKFWAVGDAGTIIHKAGWLVGWTPQSSGVNEDLNDVEFASSEVGWAVGNNGTILKFTTGPVGIDEVEECQISIFPNPCTDNTLLRLTINDQRLTICDIYSISGMKVRRLFEEELLPGQHEFDLDLNRLPAGVFFIKMKAGNDMLVRKLVVSD